MTPATSIPKTEREARERYSDPDLDLWASATLRCQTCNGVYFDAPAGKKDRILRSGGVTRRTCPYCEGKEPAKELRYD